MTRILVHGVHLNVEQHGEPGAGTPLVLLHGFTGSAASWGTVVRLLLPKSGNAEGRATSGCGGGIASDCGRMADEGTAVRGFGGDALFVATDPLPPGPTAVAVSSIRPQSEAGAPFLHSEDDVRPRWFIAIDALGHGLSDSPSDPRRYDMAHAVDDVAAVFDQLGVDRADVLGYSMGGRLALGVAILAADRVRRLALESASPGLRTERERAERVAADAALAGRIERDGVAAFVDHWERLPLFASQTRLSRETREALRAQRLRNVPLGLANSLRGFGAGAQPSLWERLRDVRAPALLVSGSDDAKFCGIASEMLQHMDRARWARVEDVGHAVHLEQPRRLTELVSEHLRREDSATRDAT